MATAADLDIKMDASSLYREEIYTDRRIGTIRAMVPVKSNGDADGARETLFIGEAQIMTQMGPLPVTFEIEAASLDAAVTGYAKAAKVAVERTVNELQELRRQSASSLVLPGQGGGAFGPGGMGGVGGLGGGGKIQIP
jgi:regulator of protease activity HflC (stomatin/prohibitin superfamily)